jgi:hypothetical protein
MRTVNHDEMRKWVKTMYVPEIRYHREAFKETKGGGDLRPLLKFDQSREAYFKITQ